MNEHSDLKSYQIQAVEDLCGQTRLAGKHILEIGGDVSFATARELIERGAREVTTVNITFPFQSRQITPQIQAVNVDARALDFDAASFDVIFGVAILEHLPDLDVVLHNLYAVLKRGGLACLRGSPIWTSDIGHHLWVKCDDGTRYRFADNNPIPEWGHLIYSEPELAELLLKLGVKQQHVGEIVEWVYHTDRINRYGMHDFERLLRNSAFHIVSLEKSGTVKPDEATRQKLVEKTGLPPDTFDYRRICVTLRKPYLFWRM